MFNTLRITAASILLAGFIAVFGAAELANAHSFNALLIQGGGDGGDVYEAFRLATKERDGHANEESDGHLGGLDVYILTSDKFDGLSDAIQNADPDFVIFLGSLIPDNPTRAIMQSLNIVSVEVPEITAQTQAAFLEGAKSGDSNFRDRFRSDYSQDPSDMAILSYIAARLIDFAVREQGEVDDRNALRTSLAKFH